MLVRRSLTLIAALVVLLAFPTAKSFAYGAADHPLAQLELSSNCNSPTSPLCSPDNGGTGGIWLWIEVDADGSADFAGAGCGHTIGGVGGPGGAGAGSIRGTGSWTYSVGPGSGFPVGQDPHNQYYIVSIFPGFDIAFPVTRGHYSFHPAPGVATETTVAP